MKRNPSAGPPKPAPALAATKPPFAYEALPVTEALPTSRDVQPEGIVGVVLDTDMPDTVAVASDVETRLVTTMPTYAVAGRSSACVATTLHCDPSLRD
jgi:hypothetical protein